VLPAWSVVDCEFNPSQVNLRLSIMKRNIKQWDDGQQFQQYQQIEQSPFTSTH
jgi:hypothetical protein